MSAVRLKTSKIKLVNLDTDEVTWHDTYAKGMFFKCNERDYMVYTTPRRSSLGYTTIVDKPLESHEIDGVVTQLQAAQKAYYAGNPIMSDNDFDALEWRLRVTDPKHDYFHKVGC